MTSEKLKLLARQLGADLCGIASMDRFEGAPPEQDPRCIFPEAKSCVVLAFRVPRGYLRGIEEGTYFSAFPCRERLCSLSSVHSSSVPYE